MRGQHAPTKRRNYSAAGNAAEEWRQNGNNSSYVYLVVQTSDKEWRQFCVMVFVLVISMPRMPVHGIRDSFRLFDRSHYERGYLRNALIIDRTTQYIHLIKRFKRQNKRIH